MIIFSFSTLHSKYIQNSPCEVNSPPRAQIRAGMRSSGITPCSRTSALSSFASALAIASVGCMASATTADQLYNCKFCASVTPATKLTSFAVATSHHNQHHVDCPRYSTAPAPGKFLFVLLYACLHAYLYVCLLAYVFACSQPLFLYLYFVLVFVFVCLCVRFFFSLTVTAPSGTIKSVNDAPSTPSVTTTTNYTTPSPAAAVARVPGAAALAGAAPVVNADHRPVFGGDQVRKKQQWTRSPLGCTGEAIVCVMCDMM